jgi:DNA-directed RNA polymerase subunit RPC12/RpoP|tara:strand:- start:292 stop:480 length:189 start_codon:yes stop_codon:yes gene_type:complete
MIEKQQKTCSSCETKYLIQWDIEVQDLQPLTCPFCGHEVEEIGDDEDEIWSNEADNEDDSWN